MSKPWSSFLHMTAIVFLSLANMMTLLGGIGTTCVAFAAEKFGPRMALLIPVKPIFQVLVVVSIAAAIYGIWAIVRFVRRQRGAYNQVMVFLVVGAAASAVQFYFSATLRGSTAPNNMRLYLTGLALLVLLLMRLPGVWEKTGFDQSTPGGKPGSAGVGGALILAGLAAITTPLWAAPTHMINGWNATTVLLWPLLGAGAALMLAGGMKIINRKRKSRAGFSTRRVKVNGE